MEYLVITALSAKEEHLQTRLAELITDMDCFILFSQGQNLGNEAAFYALISGNWNNIARLETSLQVLKSNYAFTLNLKRTSLISNEVNDSLAYNVQVIASNQIGTVFNIANFFSSRGIIIETLTTESYISTLTGTNMLLINISVSLPGETNIAEFREQFLFFCDDLNVDGILEPEKK